MKKLLLLLVIPLLMGAGCSNSFMLDKQAEKIDTLDNNEEKNILDYEPIYYVSCNDELNTCSIPRASGLPASSDMVCIWNYSSGNGNIPYIETTKGGYPSIDKYDAIWDLSVLCRDVNGKIYFGEEGDTRE